MLLSRPTIHLHVSPDSWTFSTDHTTWSAETVVYLDPTFQPSVVAAIGTPAPHAPSCVAVRLFDEPTGAFDMGTFLEAFIRHGIRHTIGRFSLQPRIQIHGASSLRTRLHGYESFVLRTALVAAGMRADSIELAD